MLYIRYLKGLKRSQELMNELFENFELIIGLIRKGNFLQIA